MLSSACNSRSSARAASTSVTQALAIVPRRRQAERDGDAARRRDAETRRPYKGEKLEHVERREAGEVEAPRDGPRMADDRDRAAALVVDLTGIEPDARLFRRQRLDLAVGGQPQDFAKPGDQRRGARQRARGPAPMPSTRGLACLRDRLRRDRRLR